MFYDTLRSSEFAYVPNLLRTIIFADENFKDECFSGGDQNTYMRNALVGCQDFFLQS